MQESKAQGRRPCRSEPERHRHRCPQSPRSRPISTTLNRCLAAGGRRPFQFFGQKRTGLGWGALWGALATAGTRWVMGTKLAIPKRLSVLQIISSRKQSRPNRLRKKLTFLQLPKRISIEGLFPKQSYRQRSLQRTRAGCAGRVGRAWRPESALSHRVCWLSKHSLTEHLLFHLQVNRLPRPPTSSFVFSGR